MFKVGWIKIRYICSGFFFIYETSRLTIDYYIEKNLPAQILFNLTKKSKVKVTFQKSLLNLEKLVNVMSAPVEA